MFSSDLIVVTKFRYHVTNPGVNDFKKEWLLQYPRISETAPEELLWRLRALQRVVLLFDTVLDEIIPVEKITAFEDNHDRSRRTLWKDPFHFFGKVRQLMPLSTEVNHVIERILRQTCSREQSSIPTIQVCCVSVVKTVDIS